MTNTNEIMKNWKEFTNTENVKEWYEMNDSDGTGYETDTIICEFCEKYNYGLCSEVYHFLDKSY